MSEQMTRAPREIGVITAEIRTLHRQAQKMILEYAVEIGRRLVEAKSLLSHGEWGDWLRDEVSFSHSTANNFMRIFEEYGAKQLGFETETNSQALANLSYTKALKLLAVPEEEREEFAEKNRVDEISTRELDRLIRERDEAAELAKEADRRATEAEEERDALADGVNNLKILAEEAEEKVKQAEARLEGLRIEAETRRKTLEDQIAEMKANPKIPKEMKDKLTASAKAAAEKELSAKIAEAEKAKEEAEKEAAEAERAALEAKERAEAAERDKAETEKLLALADQDAVLFREAFGRVQVELSRAREILERIRAKDPEKAEKFETALVRITENGGKKDVCSGNEGMGRAARGL